MVKHKASLVRGLLTGVVAGAAGALAMAGFQALVARSAGSGHKHAPAPGAENTTETTARTVTEHFGGRLSTTGKRKAGRALHYGFGTVMGAVYGIAVEYLPIIGVAGGLPFGTVLFLGTDEAVLPLLDLAVKPNETPAREHLLHWASHLAYSTTNELTRRGLVRAWDALV